MKQWCNCRITDALNSEIDRLKSELEQTRVQLAEVQANFKIKNWGSGRIEEHLSNIQKTLEAALGK